MKHPAITVYIFIKHLVQTLQKTKISGLKLIKYWSDRAASQLIQKLQKL